jgi:heme/copper-type cytochrome/quinol oxidase subunit 2
MPINVKVVSQKEFELWIEFAQEEYASNKTKMDHEILLAQK